MIYSSMKEDYICMRNSDEKLHVPSPFMFIKLITQPPFSAYVFSARRLPTALTYLLHTLVKHRELY